MKCHQLIISLKLQTKPIEFNVCMMSLLWNLEWIRKIPLKFYEPADIIAAIKRSSDQPITVIKTTCIF